MTYKELLDELERIFALPEVDEADRKRAHDLARAFKGSDLELSQLARIMAAIDRAAMGTRIAREPLPSDADDAPVSAA